VDVLGWGGAVVGDDREFRVVSDDGTEIAGWIRGQGPPLVMVHGGLGDGNPDTDFLLPFLVDHFTCYSISTRGRGLSADSADHSRERQYEDVAALVENLHEPVSIFGHSSGGAWVLGGAAAAGSACRAIALYEPALPVSRPLMRDDGYARFCDAITEDRLNDAVLIMVDDVVGPTPEERALFAMPEVVDLCAPVLPAVVLEGPEVNRPIDTKVIEKLTMPVLLVQGTRSGMHFKDAVRHLTATLPRSRVVEISGAGHLGPLTHPQLVANELIAFFKES
jgi:pimeloyl-ACP methyl ester carboxylesterase